MCVLPFCYGGVGDWMIPFFPQKSDCFSKCFFRQNGQPLPVQPNTWWTWVHQVACLSYLMSLTSLSPGFSVFLYTNIKSLCNSPTRLAYFNCCLSLQKLTTYSKSSTCTRHAPHPRVLCGKVGRQRQRNDRNKDLPQGSGVQRGDTHHKVQNFFIIVTWRNLFTLSSASKPNWLHRERLLARRKPWKPAHA